MTVSMPSSRRIRAHRLTDGRIHSMRASGMKMLALIQARVLPRSPFLPDEESMKPALVSFAFLAPRRERMRLGSMILPRYILSPSGISPASVGSVIG